MQCVILAAGKGTRMRPLTDYKPKPLIEVAGKSILEHIVSALPEVVDELVLIIGYKGDMIREFCGDKYLGRKVTYCEQENHAGGTGAALLCAKSVLHGKFLFMYGDDIHGKAALEQAVGEDHAMLSARSDHPERYGVLDTNSDGTLKEIFEKPENPPSNLINIGGFVIDTSIFNYECEVSKLGELLVTDMLTCYAEHNPVKVIVQDLWIPIGYPDDVGRAEVILSSLNR
jgi:UDP-N-acetylglucosamine diphosphorylase / glucose-1-phosphate thymidylyltransferase / UDP-N-acetylgalactosamine diphosphorylase / glucosamine-1-phosphate N-acetyltransferase / galactosamine-1-phosphate N-acetyltransferase